LRCYCAMLTTVNEPVNGMYPQIKADNYVPARCSTSARKQDDNERYYKKDIHPGLRVFCHYLLISLRNSAYICG